ncbi:ANTAR domain-containing response regulator [Desulfosporosinus sp. BICA1-9]|uniref:ANTAR domain-containing response regulator n=1 Tax=Desulfosporosinus sp. BICA1-9 TaxID=1531958 RepID=UPI00054C39C6|nr:response regulator [Desulfosporosinus sp. BICA1-9]KJS49381.1 MAG: response regulator [Peptococcaceae bacterium BRH_c23]KJS87932.1 MAG: response regulator [Desulfosporosinus sp. BICA1-9]HBW35783.1 response regulator [Desulfosporosinus sp.]
MSELSILIADDEALIRLDIKEMLQGAGHIVCGEANNGPKAVELAKSFAPDLAILDVMMPGLDGLEVAKILHSMNIPVLLLTAYSQSKFINRAEKVSVYGYLVKPITERDLLPAIQIAYARWREMQAVRAKLENTQLELQSQKTIARARSILAERNGISDYEAHQLLIHQAMDLRITVVKLAAQIIDETSKVKKNK